MPLPRRPRKEPPAITIRWQRRQMLQMEQTIASLKTVIETKDRQLGDFELQLNETGNELFSANEAAEGYRDACDKLEKKCDTLSQRLTWYEGFAAGLRTATEIYFPIIQPKLTLSQVREIKAIFRLADKLRRQNGRKIIRKGLTIELAAKYQVTKWCIRQIRYKKNWRDVK